MWVGIYLLHHDPSLWDRPEEYDPDRWLVTPLPARHAASFIPFSMGSRNCVGRRFALIEAALLLSMLAHRFDVVRSEAHPGPLVRETALVNRPRKGLFLRMTPRR